MFKKLSIEACTDITVRTLMQLQNDGHPVYRTSHAGNWSTYKLLLSELGLHDRVWEPTCIHRDVNNQPQFQLVNGTRVQLVPRVLKKPDDHIKYLTPYQRCVDEEQTLSSFHIAPLKALYGDTITTQSEEVLAFKENMQAVFEVIQNKAPSFLGRYILPCGCMVTLEDCVGGYKAKCTHSEVVVPRGKLAESAMSTIEDLYKLVYEPVGHQPKGGVLYSLELVYACSFVMDYWKCGDKKIYMLSGPDMIKYATKKSFTSRIFKVLSVLNEHLPKLIPSEVDSCIVPATLFRFGYPKGCKVSESIMAAHDTIWLLQKQKRKYLKVAEVVDPINILLKSLVDVIDAGHDTWNLFHDSANDAFYSQHDLILSQKRMVVPEHYLDIQFSVMGQMLKTLEHMQRNFGTLGHCS